MIKLVLEGVRVTLLQRDGTPVVVDDVMSLDVGEPVLVNEQASAPKKARKVAASKKLWTSTAVTDDEAKAFLAGANDEEKPTKENAKRILSVLSYIRQRAFKMEAGSTSFALADATALSTARGQGTKPSQIGRAILVAAKDPYWTNLGGITIAGACRNVGSLLARPTDQRAGLRKLLVDIARVDPLASSTLAEMLPAMTPTEAGAALASWTQRLKNQRGAT